MINVNILKGKIAEMGKTQTDVEKAIGIVPKTFYDKMSKGVFGSDEIEIMIDYLNIEDPMKNFFQNKQLIKLLNHHAAEKGGRMWHLKII